MMRLRQIFFFMIISGLFGCHASFEGANTVSVDQGEAQIETSTHLSLRQDELPSIFENIESGLAWRESQCPLHQMSFDNSGVVSDFYSGEDVPVKDAFYVGGEGVKDVAGARVVAFKERKNAKKFIDTYLQGKILTFEELVKELATQ